VICEIVFSAFPLITWISFVNESKFSKRQTMPGFLNADSLAASVLPLCAGSAELQGRASCLPSSLCAGESLQPPRPRWGNRSCNCLLGCAAINGLQVLFFGIVVIGEYIYYFLPLLAVQPV